MVGLAWPTHMTPKPLWKSRYSLPSTSHTCAPTPRSMYVGHGSLRWNDDGTPPGMTAGRGRKLARAPVRSTNVLLALRERGHGVGGGGQSHGERLYAASMRTIQSGAAARRIFPLAVLRQLVGEVDDARVLVRGLRLYVLLQLGAGRPTAQAVAEHDDRADDGAALVVGAATTAASATAEWATRADSTSNGPIR